MIGGMGSAVTPDLSKGGEINGDIVISGDLKVEGGGTTFAFDEIVQGTQVIEKTDTEAFLVRKASDGGDVLIVDTTNSRVGIGVTPSNIASFGSGSRTLELIMADSATTGNVGVQFRAGDSDYLGLAGGGGTGVGIVIHSDNNIGIGTTSPSTNLDIYDVDGATLRLRGDADGDVKTIEFGTSSAQYHKITSNANTGIMQIGGFSGSGMVLHLSADGNVRMKIDNNSRISLSNNDSGTSNTVFGKNAGASIDAGTNYNVFIGENVADATLDNATNNVGVGYDALSALTTGDDNVGVGYHSLLSITTGSKNTAIGKGSLDSLTEGIQNTALGRSSLPALTTGGNNVGLGMDAGLLTTEGNHNIFIGTESGASNTTGDELICIGYRAGYAINHATSADGTIAIGYESLKDLTSGSGNTALGFKSMKSLTTGHSNVGIGYQVMHDLDSGSNASSSYGNTFMGYNAASGTWADAASGYNVGIGYNSMSGALDGAFYNTCVGHEAGKSITTSDYNTFIGNESGESLTTSGRNTCVGHGTLRSADGSEYANTAIGMSAMGSVNNDASDYCVAVGNSALLGGTGSVATSIAIGAFALDGTGAIGGSQNIAIGYEAMTGAVANNAPFWNVAIGYQAMSAGAMDGAASNVVIGYQSGRDITEGDYNLLLGHTAGTDITTGGNNIALGYRALYTATTTSNTVCIGYQAGDAINDTGANGTIAIGYSALGALTSGGSNTAVGYQAGDSLTTGGENTIVGYACDVASNDNTNNVIIGNNLTATDKDNAVFIGNDTNHIENDFNADATWNYSSDKRQKKDIKDDILGLDFINDLRPVTYKHKSPSEFPEEWSAYNENDKEPMGGDKTIHGLIAQEVKQALDNQGVDTFSGWSVGDDGRQRISAEKFVMPLIKAVQELSVEVKQLKKQLEDK